jgi:hypothetical protein
MLLENILKILAVLSLIYIIYKVCFCRKNIEGFDVIKGVEHGAGDVYEAGKTVGHDVGVAGHAVKKGYQGAQAGKQSIVSAEASLMTAAQNRKNQPRVAINAPLAPSNILGIKKEFDILAKLESSKYIPGQTCNSKLGGVSCARRGAFSNNPNARHLIGQVLTIGEVKYEITNIITGHPFSPTTIEGDGGVLKQPWPPTLLQTVEGFYFLKATVFIFKLLVNITYKPLGRFIGWSLKKLLTGTVQGAKFLGRKVKDGLGKEGDGEGEVGEGEGIEMDDLAWSGESGIDVAEWDAMGDIGTIESGEFSIGVAGETGLDTAFGGFDIGALGAAAMAGGAALMAALAIDIFLVIIVMIVADIITSIYENGKLEVQIMKNSEWCGKNNPRIYKKYLEMENSLITEVTLKIKVDTFKEWIVNKKSNTYKLKDNIITYKNGVKNGVKYNINDKKSLIYKKYINDKKSKLTQIRKSYSAQASEASKLFDENTQFYLKMRDINEYINLLVPDTVPTGSGLECLRKMSYVNYGSDDASKAAGTSWYDGEVTTEDINTLYKKKGGKMKLKRLVKIHIDEERYAVMSKLKYTVYDKHISQLREVNKYGTDNSRCYYHLMPKILKKGKENYLSPDDIGRDPLPQAEEWCPKFDTRSGKPINKPGQYLARSMAKGGKGAWINGRNISIKETDWATEPGGSNGADSTKWHHGAPANLAGAAYYDYPIHATKSEQTDAIYNYKNFRQKDQPGSRLLKYHYKPVYFYLTNLNDYDTNFQKKVQNYLTKQHSQSDDYKHTFGSQGLYKNNDYPFSIASNGPFPISAATPKTFHGSDAAGVAPAISLSKYGVWDVFVNTYLTKPTSQFCGPYSRQVWAGGEHVPPTPGNPLSKFFDKASDCCPVYAQEVVLPNEMAGNLFINAAKNPSIWPCWANSFIDCSNPVFDMDSPIVDSPGTKGINACNKKTAYSEAKGGTRSIEDNILLTSNLNYEFGYITPHTKNPDTGTIEGGEEILLNIIEPTILNQLQLSLDESYWNKELMSDENYNKKIGCKLKEKTTYDNCKVGDQINCDYCIVKTFTLSDMKGKKNNNYIIISKNDIVKLKKWPSLNKIAETRVGSKVFISELWSFTDNKEKYTITNIDETQYILYLDKSLKNDIKKATFVSDRYNSDTCIKRPMDSTELNRISAQFGLFKGGNTNGNIKPIGDYEKPEDEWAKQMAVYKCYNKVKQDVSSEDQRDIISVNNSKPIINSITQYAISKDRYDNCRYVTNAINGNVVFDVSENPTLEGNFELDLDTNRVTQYAKLQTDEKELKILNSFNNCVNEVGGYLP